MEQKSNFTDASERLMTAHQNSDIEKFRNAFARTMVYKKQERLKEGTSSDYLMGAMDALDLFETMVRRVDAFARSAPSYISEPREAWYVQWAKLTIEEIKTKLRMPT